MTDNNVAALIMQHPEVKDIVEKFAAFPVWESLKEVGVDPVNVLAKNIELALTMHKVPSLRESFLKNCLERELRIASAGDNHGIVIGTVDDVTSKPSAPLNVIMLTEEDELKQYAMFKQSMYTGPGVYTFDAKMNDNGGLSINAILDKQPLRTNPAKFFMESSNMLTVQSPEIFEIDVKTFPTILIRGRVRYISALGIYDTEGDSSTVVGYEPIYQPNEAKPTAMMHPTLKIVLDSENGPCNVAIAFKRCRHGMPYFGVPDIDTVFDLAVNTTSDPEEQIRMVEHMFVDREYVFIGRLTHMRERTTASGEVVTNVNLRGISCFSVEDIPYMSIQEETTSPAQAISPEPLIETAEVETTPVVEPKPKKTQKKAKEELVVDAPIVDTPVEATVDAATIDGDKYPNYNLDSKTLVDNIITNAAQVVQILQTPPENITKYFVTSTLSLGERPDIPDAVWTIILNKLTNQA